jgi:hypothetical protein
MVPQKVSSAAGIVVTLLAFAAQVLAGEEVKQGGVFSVLELSFRGPRQGPTDAPARDIDFHVLFRHESGSPEHKVYGFWDGDGKRSISGNVFKVRFCPTKAGRWNLVEVRSNTPQLSDQRRGDYITAVPSDHPGFWVIDPVSPGLRWYKRSDGSHPYIFGNTHYSFVSGYEKGNKPSGNDIAADIAGNARYFKKLRFGIHGDRYTHPTEKPFLDDSGRPTDSGDFSHRANPNWFRERVDLAVRTADEHDLIADLILAGPDTEESRSTLRAQHNGGDATPYLKYIAARYGSYPNVWLCLCNEYDIRTPKYSENEIARFGQTIRRFLPYATPLSVHVTPSVLWSPKFDELPEWNDHQIVQNKLRNLAQAADVIQFTWQNPKGKNPRNKPTINDELSYQGNGDRHSEGDTIESHLGAFLGGGYATTGEKPGNKEGQYFRGKFDPSEHTAADNLQWLREVIDRNITFWRMSPNLGIFSNLDEDFRGMAWAGREYVLGTNRGRHEIVASLPPGEWTVTRYDVMTKEVTELSGNAKGRFPFDTPNSRAVLFHFKKRHE